MEASRLTLDAKRDEPDAGTAPVTKRVFVKSFGCQMNVYDSQRMTDLLSIEGYDETPAIEDADVVILNTCHIRERATEKIFSELGKVRALKAERRQVGKDTKVVVAGCVAQAEGAEIMRREKAVDVVVGPQSYQRLPVMLRRASEGRQIDTEFELDDKFARLPLPVAGPARAPSAFLTIQEGCDKFCTFCVVPYTRGPELSRPVEAVVAEAQALVDRGVREVTLLGQNVNAYHGVERAGRATSLADLCHRLAEIRGLDRIRYTTSHPCDLDDELIATHRDLPALMPFLHLPVQSGSDRILKAMNRRHGVACYVELVTKIRAARPDIALSSDFIVGFPGETEDDFRATLSLIKRVTFAATFSFKYSPRPGTPGADLPDQVAEETKRARLAELQTLVEKQRQAFNAETVGRTVDVLLERAGRHPGQLTGKSPYLQQVQIDGPQDWIGQIAKVQITSAGPNSLFGTVTDRQILKAVAA